MRLDSNWHLDDKLIPLSHQKNTFSLIYTRGSPSISARFVVRIRKIKDEKKKKLTLVRHMDLWRRGARKVPNFCAPLSQTSARRANISLFLINFFDTWKQGGLLVL